MDGIGAQLMRKDVRHNRPKLGQCLLRGKHGGV